MGEDEPKIISSEVGEREATVCEESVQVEGNNESDEDLQAGAERADDEIESPAEGVDEGAGEEIEAPEEGADEGAGVEVEEPAEKIGEETDRTETEEDSTPNDDIEDSVSGPRLVGLEGERIEESDASDEVTRSRLESLIFVSPEPITVRRLARILSIEGKRVRALLESLEEQYKDRGIILQEVSGGFQFRSHPDNASVIRQVFKLKPLKISRAALETLSIVAYRQPLTRAEVEDIRGVDSGGTLKFLFEKGLVRVFGRKEEPGRPIIYGTSQQFLELFGLKSLHDLPALHEFSELWDEHQEIVDTSGLEPAEEVQRDTEPSGDGEETSPEPESEPAPSVSESLSESVTEEITDDDEPEPESESEQDPDLESEPEQDPEPESESDIEPEPESETEPESESDTEPESETEVGGQT